MSTYRFGECVLDAKSFRVTRAGVPVHLEPKALDVLRYFVEHPGLLVSKDEVMHAVWKDTSVGDNALSRVIAQLRRGLGDPVDQPRYIETVPTRGYRFIAQPVPVYDRSGGGPAPPAAQAARRRGVSRRALLMVGTVLMGAVAGGAIAARLLRTAGKVGTEAAAPVAPVRSLAILPFRNLSGDPGQEYLAAGITQAVSDTLAQLRGLTVLSTTLSSRYGNTALKLPAISRELGADALLEGAVIRNGTRLHVSVAMVDGASGQRTWTRTYDRTTADVLALYDEIASNVAVEIKLVIDSSGASRSGRSPGVDAEAYDEYLRGMFFLGNRWMAGGCRNAERSLLRAIDRDPTFAPAYAALAWCYAYPDRLGRDIADVAPKARAAVARALSLDDRLALAHAVAGTIKWRVEYDVPAGEIELRRAMELDPNSALVLIPVAEFFLWRGQPERGFPLLERALALDPFSTDRNVGVGFSLLTVGRYQAAIADFKKALEIDPHYLTAQFWLAESYAYLGERDTAVAAYVDWLNGALRPERASASCAMLQRAYREGGWTSFWRRELELAEEEAAHPGSVWAQPYTRYTGSWYMARRYARLGDWHRALQALDAAYTGRHHLMATLTLEPLFTPLRPTARFRDLQRRTAAPN